MYFLKIPLVVSLGISFFTHLLCFIENQKKNKKSNNSGTRLFFTKRVELGKEACKRVVKVLRMQQRLPNAHVYQNLDQSVLGEFVTLNWV